MSQSPIGALYTAFFSQVKSILIFKILVETSKFIFHLFFYFLHNIISKGAGADILNFEYRPASFTERFQLTFTGSMDVFNDTPWV